ncbi:xanthine dehydrogenase family protein subunit M [soil metagenome]
MYPEQFAYHRPDSVSEAISLLNANPDAKILAGGHSLLPAMKLRLAAPSALIDIGRIGELKGISVNGGATIGAGATYRELIDAAELAVSFPMLVDAANVVGDPAVRSCGTLGGSLAHVDPAADLTAVALALDASVTVVGSGGQRTVPVSELFVGLLTTSLATDEIITSISLPSDFAGAKQAYMKHAHPASGYAVVGVAVALKMDGDSCSSARVAVTGSPEYAMRSAAAEAELQGKSVNADSIAAAAAQVTSDLGELNGDVYASADYRAHLTRVLTRRALEKATA